MYTARIAFFILVAAAVLLAQSELYRAMHAKNVRPAELLGLASGALLLIGAYASGPPSLSFGLSLTAVATFLWYLVDPNRTRATESIAATLMGVLYVPFLGAHVVLMRNLPEGPSIAIAYIGLTAFYDIGAYAAGSFWGKHTVAPSISPKKSWEGAAGGTGFIVVVAAVGGIFMDPFTPLTGIILAVVVAIVAPLGDLAESLIKRDLGVKDMGTLLPGHGGVLDRIDALLLTAPAWYWAVRALVF